MDDLVILSRAFDLLQWLVPKSEAFPRPFRHNVTPRLIGAALDLTEHLVSAQAHRGQTRKHCLASADAALGKLRLYLRLAHQWHWLSNGQYEHVSRIVAEIGRLLGGWLRQAAQHADAP